MPNFLSAITYNGLPFMAGGGGEDLGVPEVDGYVLSSTVTGVRIWVPQTAATPLSSSSPANPGIAAPGTGTEASRADHVHAPPSAGQIGDLLETTQDAVAAMLAAGANISLAYDDSAGTLTIAVTGVLADAQLSSNVPLKNGANIFTADQKIRTGSEPAGVLLSTDHLVISGDNEAPGLSIVTAGSVAGHRSVFKGVRARGTVASPAVPILGDNVVSILGAIYDGTGTQGTGMISVDVDGAVSAGVAPARVAIYTSATTGVGRVERMRIDSAGRVYLYGLRTSPASPAANEIYVDSSGFLKRG